MNARGLQDTGGPQQWYESLPIVTKHWLSAALITTVSCNFGIIKIMNIIFNYDAIASKFEIWRLFTPFLFVGKFEFRTAMTFFIMYQYSRNYEVGIGFNTGGGGGTADYMFMMLFGMILILISGALLGLGVIFATTLVYYVMYIWSKRNPTAQTNIWGIPMQAMYLPFALLGLSIVMGNPYIDMMHGYAIGHIYYFVVEVVPKVYGKVFLTTPLFLIQKFGVGEYISPAPRGGMAAVGNNTTLAPGRVNPPRDPAASTSSHNWGSGGQRLGRS